MITINKLRELIATKVELPEERAAELAKVLFEYIEETFFDDLGEAYKSKGGVALNPKEVEEILEMVQKLKEILSSIEPQYVEDTLYVDRLKQLEHKLTKILFKT